MTNEPKKYDRQIEKTKKIIMLIVVPILFATAGLLIIADLDVEKPTYVEILEEIPDLHCYNVNWFRNYGFQITYNDSIREIAELMGEYNMDFANNEFFENEEVVDYLIVNCPHIDSRLEAPEEYDAMIGVPALDKCLEVKAEFFEPEDLCLQYKD